MGYVPPPLAPVSRRPNFNPPGQGADEVSGVVERLERAQLAALVDAAQAGRQAAAQAFRCEYCGRYGPAGLCLGCGAAVKPTPATGGLGFAGALDYRPIAETASPAGQAGAGEANANAVDRNVDTRVAAATTAFGAPLALAYVAYALLWPLARALADWLDTLRP